MRGARWIALHGLCLLMVIVVRLALWCTTYQRIWAVLVRPCPDDPQLRRRGNVRRVTRGVARVARLVPGASCFTQTIASQAILSWRGIPTTISIGAKKTEDGGVYWHAWLVWNGVVVLQGDQDGLKAFSKMLDLPTPVLASA